MFDINGWNPNQVSHQSKLREITSELGFKESRKKELKDIVKQRAS